ncbi:P-loop containing nucleoside triphosphate hydrolase protein [Mycena sp. CBHHK59/15]|nr:P-loop containing nucleoside triphosphate hydrolase protein [Mycena sp. CBHHK59/15]
MHAASTEDEFVNVWGGEVDHKKSDAFHRAWSEQASAKHAAPALQAANKLREIYPAHSLVMSNQPILDFPAVLSAPLPNAPLVTNTRFRALNRNGREVAGLLIDEIEFGAFQATWDVCMAVHRPSGILLLAQKYDFIVYVATWIQGFGMTTEFFILHEGPEGPARSLVLNAGSWDQSLHEEMWVFNQGFWSKDHELWVAVQSADWKDVILKDDFKKALQKDVYGFFKSEALYKELAIPWKRGLIMHGPPGNGKTISIKVIMKTCNALGFAPLYVKSFQSYAGEEGAMLAVFTKARQLAPCVIVLEDLDALINDRNRSFFLNQLDGLQGNDGLLVIGTTNHFDRLDPGLSTRPSRFDRKFLFDDPDRDERALYARYWQEKLKSNDEIDFPDALVDEVADQTGQFSFAYLKEAFVSCLVTLAGYEGDDKPSFANSLKDQIKTLRKQLDKAPLKTQDCVATHSSDNTERDFRPLFDLISGPTSPKRFDTYPESPSSAHTDEQGRDFRRGREFRALLDRIAENSSAMRAERLFQMQGMAGSAPSAWDSALYTHMFESSKSNKRELD